ncbi:MAG: efflux RND transporter periplasmic adaptor subunit [Gammaproteobacteria bacterium]|nr:efflux RND transporter periplasmic adaptor subunit [Gammaproteobacteria bacterium]
MNRNTLLIALVILVAYVIYSVLPEPIAVNTTKVGIGSVLQVINNSRAGSVKACQRSKLSMSIGGRVDNLLVKQGDQVTKGQVLLTLWNDDQQALLQQNQALLEAAELRQQEVCLQSNYAANEARRQTELDKQKLTTQHSVDQAITNKESSAMACSQAKVMVKQAKAAVNMQDAILQQTQLVAPFDGIIAEINGEIGEYVTPSPPGVPTPPAVDLINTECLYVTIPIDEIDAAHLKLGQQAKISLDAISHQTFDATLVRISPYVQEMERQARTVDVDLQLNDVTDGVQLLIGFSADASIIQSEKNDVVRLPTQYLNDKNRLFVVQPDNTLALRSIKTGLQNWTWTEITSGLSVGDNVVVGADFNLLQQGDSVILKENSND